MTPRSIAIGLVVGAAVSIQFGAALAAALFPAAGPMGVVTLRLALGALILLALLRPRLRGRSAADWGLVLCFGVALAAMNTMLYHAIDRIPLGIAVTFELLGPLTLFVLLRRRLSSVLWAATALAGVYLLGGAAPLDLDAAGVALALGAGAAWACYIVLGARVSRRFDGADGVALALAAGAVLALPLGITSAGPALLEPAVLGLGAVVALLSSAVPYSLEIAALRRLPAGNFAVMMSLYPLTAALAGLVVLGQRLGLPELIGMLLVVVATAGAVRRGIAPAAPGDHPKGG